MGTEQEVAAAVAVATAAAMVAVAGVAVVRMAVEAVLAVVVDEDARLLALKAPLEKSGRTINRGLGTRGRPVAIRPTTVLCYRLRVCPCDTRHTIHDTRYTIHDTRYTMHDARYTAALRRRSCHMPL